MTIEGSNIDGNIAGDGAGIYNFANSVLTLRGNTRLRDNNAGGSGGGVYNAGTATLTNVTLSDNQARGGFGGGISNEEGTATLTNVTFNGNTAGVGGGGLGNLGTATLTNVTFSGNSTFGGEGGGLYNTFATASLTNVTFSGNSAISGGGIRHRLDGSVTVKNTIVANSSSGGNCSGNINNAGGNLSSDTSCGFGNAVNVMLGPLANNGGSTLTHLPRPGSPAIDFVTAGCPPPSTDQRGVTRPVDGDGNGNARCDAGAVEYRLQSVYLPLVLK